MIVGGVVAGMALAIFGALLWIIISQASDKAVSALKAELEADAAKKLEKANEIVTTRTDDDAAERSLRDGSF